jgi:hypothetical protein
MTISTTCELNDPPFGLVADALQRCIDNTRPAQLLKFRAAGTCCGGQWSSAVPSPSALQAAPTGR